MKNIMIWYLVGFMPYDQKVVLIKRFFKKIGFHKRNGNREEDDKMMFSIDFRFLVYNI